jgi:two-component system sensor histidine kinase/response regulator
VLLLTFGNINESVSRNVKILIVEDSRINRDVLLGMLKRLGYLEVDIAENGQQALTLLEQRQYDLIFMDCDMPVLDGYATVQEIRRREQGQSRTPIIALTAHALPEHRQASLAAGMDEHLTKPLFLKTVRQVLDEWSTKLAKVSPPSQDLITDSVSLPSAEETLPVLDQEILSKLNEMMGEETQYSLYQQLMVYVPQQFALMRQSIATNDQTMLRRLAHRLKGETLQIGAMRFGQLCKKLELLAYDGQLQEASVYLTRLENEWKHVITALAQENHE